MIGPGMSLAGIVPTSAFEFLLLAQAGTRKPQQGTPSFLVPSLYLIGALLVAAAIIALFNRWVRRSPEEPANPSDQLAHFRSLYEKGEISQEEFNQLRSLLGGKIRAQVQEAPAKPEQAAPDDRTTTDSASEHPTAPQNPSGHSQTPDTGIKPA